MAHLNADIQWAGGGTRTFTEVTEALDLPATDHVMAVGEFEDNYLALYTPVHDDDPRASVVFHATLACDADGVLRCVEEPSRLGVAGDFLPDH